MDELTAITETTEVAATPTETEAAQVSELRLVSRALEIIRTTLTTELQVIPAAFRGLVVNLISAKVAPILNMPQDVIDQLDTDAERLIDGIAEKDVAVVGGLIKQYRIRPDGVVGQVIARLMGARDQP